MSKIFFTHIPKTAGTSFKKELFYNNYSEDELLFFNGIKKFTFKRKNKVKVVLGHYAYGLDKFDLFVKPQYITFFRDPISRSISHYYWVLQSKYSNYVHPDWALHNKVSLEDIFSLNSKNSTNFFRLRDNMQCRYLAGIFNYNDKPNSELLKRAVNNLDKYLIYGIQDEYESSVLKISQYLNLEKHSNEQKEKKTNVKPNIDLNTMNIVKENNKLDLELYEIVKERFHSF